MSDHDQPPSAAEPPSWATPGYEVLSNDGTTLSSGTIVPTAEAQAGPSRRRRWVAAGAAAVLVIGIGAGAVAVAGALGGGGAQPETVVPADAVFYAELDLDPSAGQKVDAFRFLRKFPALKDAFTADGGYGPDFAKLFKDSTIDYAADVQPWLGKRFAVALVPGKSAKAPARVMIVLQTSDEAKAKESLSRVLKESNEDHLSVAASGGYLVLATTLDFSLLEDPSAGADEGLAQELVDDAAQGSLANASAYTSAVQPYGDSVATVWADNEGLADASKAMTAGLGLMGGAFGPATSGTGTTVAVVRFDGGALEVVGGTTDVTYTVPSGGVPALMTLPESTLVAVGGNDVGSLLKAVYGPVWEQLGSLALGVTGSGGSGGAAVTDDQIEQFCKDFPDDCDAFKDSVKAQQPAADDPFGELGAAGDPDQWPTLFGQQTVLAVGADGSQPSVGLHVVGGDKTVRAIEDLVARVHGQVVSQQVPDGVVVASDAAWAGQLAQQGSFGDSKVFRDAAPEAAGAGYVAFVDVDGLVDAFGADLSAEDRENLDPIRAVGFTVTTTGDSSTFRVRVLTD